MRKLLTHPKVIGTWNFIKLLRVEPLLLLIAFGIGLKEEPSNQIIQDKICMQWYNTTAQYCHDLPTTKEDDHYGDHYKTRVLGDSAQFGKFSPTFC